jgi:drug/metabolite transporter (DMT)-like permease
MLYWFAIGLAIFSNIFYHVCQKTIPANVNPVISLVATYLTAAVASLLLLPFFPVSGSLAVEFKKLTVPSLALGLTTIGLELAFLLMYRAGWNISVAGLVVGATAALCFVPIGYFFFGSIITVRSVLGVLLCIAGLVLINFR